MSAGVAPSAFRARLVLGTVTVGALYLVAAKLGLKLAFLHASATPIWPPTGIALAAFLLLGARVWPGVFAGAFLANVTTAGTVWTSLGIATGNTLEGLLGAWLALRYAGGRRAFETTRNVLAFALLAGLVSTVVSPTFGVTSLDLGGFLPPGQYGPVWLTWWLGDVGGDLVVAPLLILVGTGGLRWGHGRRAEAVLLMGALLLVGLTVFGGLVPRLSRAPVAFLGIPPLLWAAFRFGPREAAAATTLTSGIAIWGVLHGHGPFGWRSPNESLLVLQAFMGVTGVTTLAVSAAVAERRRVEDALARSAAIVDSSDDAIIGKTLDGTIVSWNSGAERLYGYAAAEVTGRSISILAPKERTDDVSDILRNVRDGQSVEHYETERVRKDGRRVVVSLRISPIRDAGGVIVGASAIARDVTDQKRAAERLAQALDGLRRLQKAVETIQMGVTLTDMGGRILYTNPAEAAAHGYRVEELVGRHVSVFMPQRWEPAPGRPTEVRSWRRETVNVRKDGTIFPVQLLSDAVTGADGVPIGVVTCCEEITERKRAEGALRSSEERYRLLFERNLAGVYRATVGGRLLECNEAFARILGYASRDEVLALTAWDLFFERADREASLMRLRDKGSLTNFELRMRRKDGSGAWVLENESLLPGPDGEEIVQGTLIDVTDRKLAEEKIEFHAYHDPLTGLPNRTFLKDRLHFHLAQARRSGRGMAVLFLDLDRFKTVNDSLGHSLGDRVLCETASRLREGVREDDTVARIGGDEFVLLLPQVRQGEGAARIARKLLRSVGEPCRLDGRELCVTASIGIVLFPQDGEDAETLLKKADAAMYRAKEQGRNGYQFHDPAAERLATGRLDMQSRLRQAVDRGEMMLAYQPFLDLAAGRIVATEALLRWRHPERGTVLPAEFVPMAEDLGVIVPLGEWALRQACLDGVGWRQRGLPAVRVSVNLSVQQFRSPHFGRTVETVLEETGLPPECLDLEITESVAMQDFDRTVPLLRRLVDMGVGVAIDDFGKGYSSLSYLKLLPISRLKIDRSFIAGIGREPRDTAIVKAIIRMALSLGLGTVAEGVETQEQVAILRELQCREIQGWVVSDAVPEPAFAALLTSSDRWWAASAPAPGGRSDV